MIPILGSLLPSVLGGVSGNSSGGLAQAAGALVNPMSGGLLDNATKLLGGLFGR